MTKDTSNLLKATANRSSSNSARNTEALPVDLPVTAIAVLPPPDTPTRELIPLITALEDQARREHTHRSKVVRVARKARKESEPH